MKNTKYDRIADLYKADEHRVRNACLAFLVGGLIGFLGEAIIMILTLVLFKSGGWVYYGEDQ